MNRLKIMKVYFIFWLFVYFIIYSNIEQVQIYFFATLTFNLAVLTMLVLGTLFILNAAIKLVVLAGTFGALAYKQSNYEFYLKGIEKIMPPHIAAMFASRKNAKQLLFSSEEAKDVIEWLEDRFYNQKSYINFFISTALMIGLLGTFTGLLTAIDDMGKIILSLSGDIDLGEVIQGFAGPLSGMAVGFGSSLFGVATSVLLGIKAFILARNQEQFIEGVEGWLKERIVDANVDPESGDLAGGKHNMMEVFIEEISKMSEATKPLSQLGDSLGTMSSSMSEEKELVATLLKLQEDQNSSTVSSIDVLSEIKSMGSMSNEHLATLAKTAQASLEQAGGEQELLSTLSNNTNEHLSSSRKQEELLEKMSEQNHLMSQNMQQLNSDRHSDTIKEHELLSSMVSTQQKVEVTLNSQMQTLSTMATYHQTQITKSDTQSKHLTTLNSTLSTLGEHLTTMNQTQEQGNESLTLQNRYLGELKGHLGTQDKQNELLNKTMSKIADQDAKSVKILDTMSQQNVTIQKSITSISSIIEQDFNDAQRQMHKLFDSMNRRLESSEKELLNLQKIAANELKLLESNHKESASLAKEDRSLAIKQHKEIVRHLSREVTSLNSLKKSMEKSSKASLKQAQSHDAHHEKEEDAGDEPKASNFFSKILGK
jgi:hypothetical protein